jgi:hypothetical protein
MVISITFFFIQNMFAGALTTGFSHKTEIYTAPASDRFAGSHELFCAMHAGTYQLKKKPWY